MESNFDFLKNYEDAIIFEDLVKAEKNAFVDSRAAYMYMRNAAFHTLSTIFTKNKWERPKYKDKINESLSAYINTAKYKNGLSEISINTLEKVRDYGNTASHYSLEKIIPDNATEDLKNLFDFTFWFFMKYIKLINKPIFNSDLIPKETLEKKSRKEIDELTQILENQSLNFQNKLDELENENIILAKKNRDLSEESSNTFQELNKLVDSDEKPKFEDCSIISKNNLFQKLIINFNFSDNQFYSVSEFYANRISTFLCKGHFDYSGCQEHDLKQNISIDAIKKQRLDSNYSNVKLSETLEIAKEYVLKQMKNKFDFTASYYTINERLFRDRLIIKKTRLNPENKKYDLIVVMMNPGASMPKDNVCEIESFQDVKNNIIECVPDDTQYQIVRLMNLLNCNYALVLNMYDECNPNSTEILTNRSFKVELLSSDSIFNESRNDELKKHFENLDSEASIVLGWGVSPDTLELRKSIKNIIKKISNNRIIGDLKSGSKYDYYHPWPRRGNDDSSLKTKLQWPDRVLNQINDYKILNTQQDEIKKENKSYNLDEFFNLNISNDQLIGFNNLVEKGFHGMELINSEYYASHFHLKTKIAKGELRSKISEISSLNLYIEAKKNLDFSLWPVVKYEKDEKPLQKYKLSWLLEFFNS